MEPVSSISPELFEKAKEKISFEEGIENKIYECSAGFKTIGIGHNLDENPISDAAVDQIFRDDLSTVIEQLDTEFSWWREKPENIQVFMLDFVFNVGIGTAKKFVNMMTFLKAGAYKSAAVALLKSRYAQQVPNRARRNASLIESSVS